MTLNLIMLVFQVFCSAVICIYFFSQIKIQKSSRVAVDKNSDREMEKLRKLRARTLTQPLSEKARPKVFEDIIGQSEGIKALKAALCGPNPQHVIVYGPPGVGKTCAARLVLEEAKKMPGSPFRKDSLFIEMDATCVRFDERAIADPLIGSVHDPIYQGAGALGVAGVPQPKPGAVTKANAGVLFLDEIGELHPVQMNKLLKVLEDRKVHFESAYYNPDDKNIPLHIHDIFKYGLPADFRLIGATTCNPSDLPPAIRSRCLELHFRSLNQDELSTIALNAAEKSGASIDEATATLAAKYCSNGRDVVNMIQLAAGVAYGDCREWITQADIEWVAETTCKHPHIERRIPSKKQPGLAIGLAVTPDGQGVVMEIEALAKECKRGQGKLIVTGIIDEEEIGTGSRKVRRRSTASASVENVLTAMRNIADIDARDYDIHVNFPGGTPVDGPSAGIAIALAVYSSIKGIAGDNTLALTGEVSIRGLVKPVGGVKAKIEAAVRAGAKKVIIPYENFRESFSTIGAKIIPVKELSEVIKHAFSDLVEDSFEQPIVLSAESIAAENIAKKGID